MNRRFPAIPLACGAICICVLSAAQRTLPEIVKQSNGIPVSKERASEFVAPPFQDLVVTADLIVEGEVTPQQTYLSDDQMDLYTDFVVTPRRILATRHPLQSTPGAPAIILKQFGGRTVIDGVQVADADQNMPPLKAGTLVILLLKHSRSSGKFELPGGIFGVFAVDNGQIFPALRGSRAYEKLRGMATADFEAEIHRLRP